MGNPLDGTLDPEPEVVEVVEPTPDHDGVGPVPTSGQLEAYDDDGDGVLDRVIGVLGTDLVVITDDDFDGSADSAFIDIDGDGVHDLVVTEQDGGYLMIDPVTGVQEWAERAELEEVRPDLVALLDSTFTAVEDGQPDPAPQPEPGPGPDEGWQVVDGQLIGDPLGDAQYWFQQAQNGFCLPASIAQIVSEYTGQSFTDEMVFVDIANEFGAFVVGYDGIPGIPFDKGVDILHAAGVPAELGIGDLESLAAHLAEGYSIIVAVDSGELWTGEEQEDLVPDHAVLVTGIDVERETVLVSDPGHPGGNVAEYPIDLFLNAWADSENAWIVTAEPAPSGPQDGQPTADVLTAPMDTSAPTDEAAPVPDDVTLPDLTEQSEEMGTLTRPVPDLVMAPDLRDGISGGGAIELAAPWNPSGDGSDQPGPVDQVTAWALEHPWIVIPVALLARHLVTRSRDETSTGI